MTIVKNLKRVVRTYFNHQSDKLDNLQRILKEKKNRALKVENCMALIKEVKNLMMSQKCKVYRKFKEQIIVQVFGDTKYLLLNEG